MASRQIRRVCIIGAGPIGVSSAIYLAKLGYKVELVDRSSDILMGASRSAYILHNDGFEYYSHDQQTGFDCVDGGVALNLMYKPHIFRTATCNRNNRIRFLVAKEAEGSIPLESFRANAEAMRDRYRRNFEYVDEVKNLGAASAALLLHGMPDEFTRVLKDSEFDDLGHVVGGNTGSGAGLNMPVFYAVHKALLEQYSDNITFHPGTELQSAKKMGDGRYNIVLSDSMEFAADYMAITSGQSIPRDVSKIDNAVAAPSGMYYLNCMSKIRLPKLSGLGLESSSKRALLKSLDTVNFVLQGKHGCSFVGITKPTDHQDGYAVSYFPSMEGSQIHEFQYNGLGSELPPKEFEDILKYGLGQGENSRKEKCLTQLHKIYTATGTRYTKEPYVKLEDITFSYGCVFSAGAQELQLQEGEDVRSHRPGVPVTVVTPDNQIIVMHGPKVTTVVPQSLKVVDHILQWDRNKELNKTPEGGFDICEISRRIGNKGVVARIEDAVVNAQRNGLPTGMINTDFNRGLFGDRTSALGADDLLARV